MLEVELDIFSGMPNPAWTLSKCQEATLFEMLNTEPRQISPVNTPNEPFGASSSTKARRVTLHRQQGDQGRLRRRLAGAHGQPSGRNYRR